MKYKLIKKLPFENSPKMGYISIEKESLQSNKSHSWMSLWFKPEQHPEFWEKIVEKDYEILSFINVNNKIYKLQKDGRYFHYELKYNEYNYCLSQLKIHSIKRLSDGEVFTIGDKIQLDNDNKEYGTITELYISHEQLRFYCDTLGGVLCHDLDKRNNFTIYISKKPLFTTEDGVGIFEEDKFYVLVTPFNDKNKTNICEQTASSYYRDCKLLTFFTKEKAEEYILMNKPCLSLNDIVKNCLNINNSNCKTITESLKQLVKTKINK
jgi:hypothetical protein